MTNDSLNDKQSGDLIDNQNQNNNALKGLFSNLAPRSRAMKIIRYPGKTTAFGERYVHTDENLIDSDIVTRTAL